MSALEWLLKAAEEAGTHEGVVPAMEKLVGKISKSAHPNSELIRQLAVMELSDAKAGVGAYKSGIKELLGNSEAVEPTLKQAEVLDLDSATPQQQMDAFFPPAKVPPAEVSRRREQLKKFSDPNLYKPSGAVKVMSIHETEPHKLAELLRAAEEKGGDVEPALTMPSLAYQRASMIESEGRLPENFGKTALIYGPETAAPQAKGVRAFDSDAYVYRRPKSKPEITQEGKRVHWIGDPERKSSAYTKDSNLIEIPVQGEVGEGQDPRFVNDRQVIFEWPKDIKRGDVIDAFKIDRFEPSSGSFYDGLPVLSAEEKLHYTPNYTWDDRIQKNVWVKWPKREEDLVAYGFKPTTHQTTEFPDPNYRSDKGRWILEDKPEDVYEHLSEKYGDVRQTEGIQYSPEGKTPSGFTESRARFANPINTSKELRRSLGSSKHQHLKAREMGKIEEAAGAFFKKFHRKSLDAYAKEMKDWEESLNIDQKTPFQSKISKYASPYAEETLTKGDSYDYLEKLEKTGTGGDKELDKLGLQYLLFIKAAPADYYEAKIFRNVPLKEAKALYMPQHLYEGALKYLAKYDHGLSLGASPQYASDLAGANDYSWKHAGILVQAMKKRNIPVVTDIGDLLKYSWVIPIIGPGGAYIAGSKKKQASRGDTGG